MYSSANTFAPVSTLATASLFASTTTYASSPVAPVYRPVQAVPAALEVAFPAPSSLSAEEEIANTITHGLGFVLSVFGASVMADAFGPSDAWRVAGCAIFVTSMIAVYAMSTLSHIFQSPKLRSTFRAIDQGTIYLLIAGTYTPFSLAFLHSTPWWFLLAAVWAVAAYGFVSKILFTHRVENVSMWPCVLCGALPFLAIPKLLTMLPVACLAWMMLGVACYVLGLVFWMNDRKVRHFHAMWHLLVMAGSTAHFSGVLLFIVLGQ